MKYTHWSLFWHELNNSKFAYAKIEKSIMNF